MDQDVCDLLMAWFSAEVEEPRRQTLLARLHTDAEFRRRFVDELYLLGQLKAVQSPEPRWLLLQDELWWSSQLRPPEQRLDPFERETMRKIRKEQAAAGLQGVSTDDDLRRGQQHAAEEGRRRFRLLPWILRSRRLLLVGLFAATLVAIWLSYVFQPTTPLEAEKEVSATDISGKLAVLVQADHVEWGAGSEFRPAAGDVVAAGILRADQGRFSLAFLNGVLLHIEAPATIELLSTDEVSCSQGRLRAQVPPGAQGFTVKAFGYSVVDVGTEFGLNVKPDGRAEVFVFEGQAKVSLLNGANVATRSKLLGANASAEFDATTKQIDDAALPAANFAQRPDLSPPALALRPAYREEVIAAKPWAYWRFESSVDQAFANEIPGGRTMRGFGAMQMHAEGTENKSIGFADGVRDQYLQMDGDWTLPTRKAFAVEAWVMPEGFQHANLVALIAAADDPANDRHAAALELLAVGETRQERSASVRLLLRWPPGSRGGVNAYSKTIYQPYRWQHIVGQRDGQELQVFLNGELKASAAVTPDDVIRTSRVVVGRAGRLLTTRPFVGRLDELALYDRALSPAEIRQHYAIGAKALRTDGP